MATTYQIADERGVTFRNNGVLVTASCPTCHILYAIPKTLHDRARERSLASEYETLFVYCPNGHWWHYMGKNEKQRLSDALAAQHRANDDLLDRLNVTERDRRRIVKRVTNGVCIECNRSFQNLERHMKTKHGHGPTGSLSALLVHKRQGQRAGTSVKCYARVALERTSYRWADVDCPKCLAARPAVPA